MVIHQVDPDTQRICTLAHRFRKAMDLTDFRDTQWLSRFPTDSCDITCKLLGRYFYESAHRDFAIMRGKRPDDDDGKHQWLQLGEVIVDITADQFDMESQPSVIVATYSPWHVALGGKHFRQFDDDYYRRLTESSGTQFTRDMYQRIRDNL